MWLTHLIFLSYFSGLKPNWRKSEISTNGVLTGVQVAVWGMCCVDLNNSKLKISATHLSYNEQLKEKKKFKTIIDIQRVLKIWKMRKLTLEEKIVIFKTIAILIIFFQWFVSTVPKYVVNELEKNTKGFFMEQLYS